MACGGKLTPFHGAGSNALEGLWVMEITARKAKGCSGTKNTCRAGSQPQPKRNMPDFLKHNRQNCRELISMLHVPDPS